MAKKKEIVVFTGAGISAESGIGTFRDNGGIWDKYNINEVATPEAWAKNPALVLEFYNERRQQILHAQPNAAHYALVDLETQFNVHIITQNIDDLHERAGSKKIVHLHGEILKARSAKNPDLIYPVKNGELKLGDCCAMGSQLRPHIVWFGETVPEMELAQEIASTAHAFVIIGTSLNVYPAANLVYHVPDQCPVFIVDPKNVHGRTAIDNLIFIRQNATEGVPILVKQLLNGFLDSLTKRNKKVPTK
jgi:NAD-dependent deacetylase